MDEHENDHLRWQSLHEQLNALDNNLIFVVQEIKLIRQYQALSRNLLKVIIKGGKLHEIGGYTYGRTSNDDAFVILYPTKESLIHKVCRVYQENFHKLPYFIPTSNIPADATENNPDKNKARRGNIYHDCPIFTIATEPGKETQMGNEVRFMMTVEETPNEESKINQMQSEIAKEIVEDVEDTEDNHHDDPPAEEPTTQQPPPPDNIAPDHLNDMLGVGESNSETPALITPYTYEDGTAVADHPKSQAVFKAHHEIHHHVPANSDALRDWYERNKNFVEDAYLKKLI